MTDLSVLSTLTQEDRTALDSENYDAISPEGMGIINAVDVPEAPTGPTRSRSFREGFEDAKTPERMLSQLMESVLPLGKIMDGRWIGPTELHGEMFMDATPADRRAVLAREEQKREAQIEQETIETTASMAGDLLGTVLKSPTTLLFPVGKGVAQGAVAGFSYSAMFDVLEQKTGKDEVKLDQALMAGGLGAAFGGVLNFGVGKLTKLGEKAKKVKADPAKVRISNTKINEIEELSQKAIIDKVPTADIPGVVAAKMGVEEDLVRLWTATANRGLNLSVGESAEKISRVIASKGTRMDDFIQPIKSRIEKWSPEVAAKLDIYEFNIRKTQAAYETIATPFITGFQKASKPAQRQLSLYLMNANYAAAKKYAVSQGMTGESIDALQGLMKRVHTELKDAGVERANLEDFFVRTVKDHDGLMKVTGKDSGPMARMYTQHARNAQRSKDTFTASEKNGLMDSWLKGKNVEVQNSRTAQRRGFDVTESMLPFYEDPVVALTNYLAKAADDLAYADFFGAGVKTPVKSRKQLAKNKEDFEGVVVETLDTDTNIRTMLEGFYKGSPEGAQEIAEMLQARFGAAREPTSKTVNQLRYLGYISTIGNPMSALTQLKDVSITAATKGIRNTFLSLVRPDQVKLLDIHIKSALDADFASISALSKSLNTALKVSGFATLDRFGKTTFINASLRKNQALARSNPDAIRKQYGPMFGDEIDDLVRDFASKKVTERVHQSLFSDLTGVQPITMSENSAVYLNNPNGRIAYMLKTFTLKQMDVLRKGVIDEAKKGNYAKAGMFASKYTVLYGAAGGTVDEIKDFARGRGFHPEDIPVNVVNNLLGIVFLNRFMGEQLMNGEVVDVGVDLVVPPLDYIQGAVGDLLETFKAVSTGESLSDIDYKIGDDLPFVGPWWGQILDSLQGEDLSLTGGPRIRERRLEEKRTRRESSLSRAVTQAIN